MVVYVSPLGTYINLSAVVLPLWIPENNDLIIRFLEAMTQIIMQKKYEAANYTDLLLAFQTLDEGKRSYEHISSAAISFINIYV